MPQLPANHVFISYSRRDTEIMRHIVSYLRTRGIKAWVDDEKLIPGTPVWEDEIEKAIKSASSIVVVLSPDAKNSEWVRREISLADQNRKRIFPVLVGGDEDTSISLRLITRQFVDLRKNEETGLASLHSALSEYLGETEVQTDKKGSETTEKEYPEKASTDMAAEREFSSRKNEKTATSPIGSQTLVLYALGWAIAGLFGGFLYSEYSDFVGGAMGGTVGGAIGGFLTPLALRGGKIPPNQKNMVRVILSWAIAGSIGWFVGWGLLTEALGAGLGMAIFAIIGLAGTLDLNYIRSNWKNIGWIILAWAIGGAVGWPIAIGMIDGLDIDYSNSWAIGTAIGWGIGGFVMGWQLLKNKDDS